MKFDDKYPQVVELVRSKAHEFKPLPWGDPEFLKATEPEPCIVFMGMHYACDTGLGGCGTPTGWVDIGWGVGVHCCSEECHKAMWDQYAQVAETGTDIKQEVVEGVGNSESHFKAPAPCVPDHSHAPDSIPAEISDVPTVRADVETMTANLETLARMTEGEPSTPVAVTAPESE